MKNRSNILRHYVADIIHNTTNMDEVFDYGKFVEDVNAEYYTEYVCLLSSFDISIASQLYMSMLDKERQLADALKYRLDMLNTGATEISGLAEMRAKIDKLTANEISHLADFSARITKLIAKNGGKDILIQVDADGNVEALTYREVADAGVYTI